MSEAVISIQNLSKTFGTNEVLKDISFEVKQGEVVTIIGSSGSGKSTLLRCVNLLEKPTSGEIYYNGQNILEHDKSIYEYRKIRVTVNVMMKYKINVTKNVSK